MNSVNCHCRCFFSHQQKRAPVKKRKMTTTTKTTKKRTKEVVEVVTEVVPVPEAAAPTVAPEGVVATVVTEEAVAKEEEEEEDNSSSPEDMVVQRAKWVKREGDDEMEFQFHVKFLDNSGPPASLCPAAAVFGDSQEVVKQFIRKNKRHAKDCFTFSDDPEFSDLAAQHSADTVSKQHRGRSAVLKQVRILCCCFCFVFELL